MQPSLSHINTSGKTLFTFVAGTLIVFLALVLAVFIGTITESSWALNAFGEGSIFYGPIEWLNQFKYLPLVILGLPVVASIAQLIYGRHVCNRRDYFVVISSFLTIIAVLLMYPLSKDGGFALDLPHVLGFGLTFYIDMLGFTMLLITSILWFLVMIYAHEYMKFEHCSNRFFVFMAFTYSSVLGTVMSGDLLTMFLSFEIMTFASYMLVVHGQKKESFEAGYNYIFMGIIGGFAILIAMSLLYYHVGDLRFQSAIHALSEIGFERYLIIGLLIFGFGIKAGMAPVHVWLPKAHPVAPTPASALLSGIMIKVGAFGMLRVATSYYFPAQNSVSDYLDPIWQSSENIGFYVIWLGIVTMAIAVFLALQQSNIKRMLAYHSISQMGYIVLGIGVALYLGYRGAMGYSGAIYHIINHALFKSLLFMAAGVIIIKTQEANMYKLGGLLKHMPITSTVTIIAVLGISGVPLFNGFISKTILHHGIDEAYYYGHQSFYYAEMIFNVISAGTVCSFIKLYYYVFLRKTDNDYQFDKTYNSLDLSMGFIAILIILIGLFPHFILQNFIAPSLNQTTYDKAFISHYIVELSFFTGKDLLTMLFVIIGGFLMFFIGTKFHLFHLKLPGWMRLEFLLFYPVNKSMQKTCEAIYGERCPISEEELKSLKLKQNEDIGLLKRFVIMANTINRRYETQIIQSDALIYSLSLLVLLIIFALYTIF